jgi:hypothetical protein
MSRFAEVADLQKKTKVVYRGADIPWVEQLLEDATNELRRIIGWQVYPAAVVSYRTLLRGCEHYTLPVQPVVDAPVVTIDGSTVDVDFYDGGFTVLCGGIATVTFTAGYDSPPPDLVTWCCVLAQQVIDAIQKLGLLGPGGLSSVSIDDFKLVWSQDGSTGGGYTLPERIEESLKQSYGSSAYVTGK